MNTKTKRARYDESFKAEIDRIAVALTDAGFNFCFAVELDVNDEGETYSFNLVSAVNMKSANCMDGQVNPQLIAAVCVTTNPEFGAAVTEYAEQAGIVPGTTDAMNEYATELDPPSRLQ